MPIGTLFTHYYNVEFGNYRKAVSIAQNEARTHEAPRYVIPSENGFRVLRDAPPEGTENVTVIQADGTYKVPPALYDHYTV